MTETVFGLAIGVITVVVVMLTAPWWIPLVDRPFNAWCEWVDRRIEKREQHR